MKRKLTNLEKLLILTFIVIVSVAFAPQFARYRGGISAAEDSWIRNGMDIIWYNGSVSSTNETHRVDGAGGVVASAPTAVATSTPAMVVDSVGVSNLLEVRDAATPVLTVRDGGRTIANNAVNFADTDSVLTGAQTITPTYSYLQVSPTALLTITLDTGSAEDGDILIVHNLVTTNTNIVDTGATAGGAAIDLGQDDLAGFIFGDGVWVELFSPDNS